MGRSSTLTPAGADLIVPIAASDQASQERSPQAMTINARPVMYRLRCVLFILLCVLRLLISIWCASDNMLDVVVGHLLYSVNSIDLMFFAIIPTALNVSGV